MEERCRSFLFSLIAIKYFNEVLELDCVIIVPDSILGILKILIKQSEAVFYSSSRNVPF